MRKILFIILILSTNLISFEDKKTNYRENIANFYYKFLDISTSFLYDKSNYNYIKKHNTLRFYINNSIDKNGNLKTSPSIRASIKLPRISKNLYITVEKDSKVTDNPNEIETPSIKEERSSRIGLKYYFIKDKDFSLFSKIGGRPSKVYIQEGIEKLFKLDVHYFFTYFHENYYFEDKIFATEFGIDYKQKLDNTFVFLENNGIRIEDKQNTTLLNSFILEQYINPKSNLTYWMTLYSIKYNSLNLDSISYNFKYHRMLKKWIFVDIIPSLVKNYNTRDNFDKYLYINFGFIF